MTVKNSVVSTRIRQISTHLFRLINFVTSKPGLDFLFLLYFLKFLLLLLHFPSRRRKKKPAPLYLSLPHFYFSKLLTYLPTYINIYHSTYPPIHLFSHPGRYLHVRWERSFLLFCCLSCPVFNLIIFYSPFACGTRPRRTIVSKIYP